MFGLLFWGAVALLAVQFAASFVAAVTTSERDNALLARAGAAVGWLLSANARAGAAAGAYARAKWDAWRARRAG